ncbi:MAG: BamA/TamA family outer membrane protein [Ignavibacteriales bacterium]|nr:BamA/TamA family outer membrane protein [Ignavibacteriales bacterium]
MKTFTLDLIIATASAIMISSASIAQESSEKSKFRAEVDSIVDDILTRFDEKMGTYIFSEEPSEDEDFAETECSGVNDENDYEDGSAHRRIRCTSTFYAVKPEQSIVRNTFPVFPWEIIDEHILFRYNRVEGLFLGLNYPKKYYWNDDKLTLFASGGYGFKAHRWRGGIGAAQQFGSGSSSIEVGSEVHSFTDTRDQWLIDLDENNLAALLLRDDYRDYYGREGFSVWTGFYERWLKTDLQFQIAYINDQYESLDRTTSWSLFGGEKTFRENLPIDEGRMKSILATFKIHSTQSRRIFTSGWSASISMETAGRSLGGDYDFNSYIIDLRRYQPITRYGNLNIRLRAASVTDDVPYQKAFDLGGLSTLPAYRFKEFIGNRMLLANAEYVVNGKMFDDVEFFPSWLLRNVNIIFFADGGYIANADDDASPFEGYKALDWRTLHSDWGIGIGTRDAKLRLGFAWRTDKSTPPMVFLRLNRPF